MSNVDVIRAWKEANYRKGLSQEELAGLPQNPAGLVDLSDTELEGVAGGATEYVLTMGCCGGLTASTCGCSFGCGSNTCYSVTWCVDTRGCGSKTHYMDEVEIMY
jgi:mersacidin/lichenicidin family type 2 lantibiotic